MAIYHLHTKIFSRAKAHSAVAAIAYRRAEKMFDQRCDVEYNFNKKIMLCIAN